MIETHDLVFGYGDDTILDGTDFRAESGEVTVLMGKNGAGKSTLLRQFNGLLEPDSGEVYVGGEKVRYDDDSLENLRQRVGYVFQDPNDQIIAPTVSQDVRFGLKNAGIEDDGRLEEALETMGISGYGDRLCNTLSGGEKKRVALAGVLVMEPDYILLDEPTAGLDGEGCDAIIEIVEKLSKEGITLVISTHDTGFGLEVGDSIAVLENGIIDYTGDSISPETAERYGLRTFVF